MQNSKSKKFNATDVKIKEIEILINAVYHQDRMTNTTMVIFYPLNGLLLSFAITLNGLHFILIATFGIISILVLTLITCRNRNIRSNLIRRIKKVEKELNFDIISNLEKNLVNYRPIILYKFSAYGSIIFFNFVIIIIWLFFIVIKVLLIG